MTTTDLTARSATAVDFIASLPKLEPLEPLVAAEPANEPSGSVAGTTTMAFTSNLDSTHKTALLYAVGYVQLQAVQNFGKDPKADPIAYVDQCIDLLQHIGFAVQDMNWANFNSKAKTFELDQVVLQIVGELLTAPELALVDAAVEALKTAASSGDPSWTIYSQSSVSNDAGGFSLGLANQTQGPDGSANVSFNWSAFSFDGTEDHTKFLWMTYDSTSFHMKHANTTLVLNDDLWNTDGVGNAISAAMKSLSKNYIANLPPLKPKS